jgi:predicted DNA-binding transcriptional regulator YafY
VLEYQKHIGEEVKEIYTAPVHLVLMRDCFYIYAWMLDRNNLQNNLYEAPTKYSVHRIKAVRIIEDSSSKHLPAGNSDKGYFGFIDDEEVYEVTLKFSDPYSITYVADRIWSTDQEITFNKDGTMLLKFKSTSYYEVMSFINSFGDQVEVIAPDTFREDVKSVIKKLVKLYGIDKE